MKLIIDFKDGRKDCNLLHIAMDLAQADFERKQGENSGSIHQMDGTLVANWEFKNE